MDRKVTNTAASVRQRLLNRARSEGRAFQELATLYAMERFLYRLGRSQHAELFVLKGGLMTMTWAGEYARLTRDIDLLGRGTNSIEAVVARIREVLALEVEDGVRFDAEDVQGAQITAEAAHVGVRVVFPADFGGMALKMQIDVGFGDAVVPDPTWIAYPQLLDLGQPRLLGYPAEATLAEKLHAVVNLGFANSRMKDDYDLWTAQRLSITTPELLGTAVLRCGTPSSGARRSYRPCCPRGSPRRSRPTRRSGRSGRGSCASHGSRRQTSSRSWPQSRSWRRRGLPLQGPRHESARGAADFGCGDAARRVVGHDRGELVRWRPLPRRVPERRWGLAVPSPRGRGREAQGGGVAGLQRAR